MARAVTQRGADSCTPTLSSAMLSMYAAPVTARAAAVSITFELSAMMPIIRLATMAHRRTAVSGFIRLRTSLTTSAPSTAPTPFAPSSNPNVLALPASRLRATSGVSAEIDAAASPSVNARISTMRIGGEWMA